jgi:hypothetical protein
LSSDEFDTKSEVSHKQLCALLSRVDCIPRICSPHSLFSPPPLPLTPHPRWRDCSGRSWRRYARVIRRKCRRSSGSSNFTLTQRAPLCSCQPRRPKLS